MDVRNLPIQIGNGVELQRDGDTLIIQQKLPEHTHDQHEGRCLACIAEASGTTGPRSINVKLPAQAVALAHAVWQLQLDYRNERPDYKMDDRYGAYLIMEYWERGTASNFEKQFIELYQAGDSNMRTRLALLFPAMANAFQDWRSDKAAFRERVREATEREEDATWGF